VTFGHVRRGEPIPSRADLLQFAGSSHASQRACVDALSRGITSADDGSGPSELQDAGRGRRSVRLCASSHDEVYAFYRKVEAARRARNPVLHAVHVLT
jgi:hypothetical protein